MTLSVPPYGFWPLALAGFVLLYWRLEGLTWKQRLLAGAAAGLGLFAPGIYWITDFQQVGYVALTILELSFVALAAVLTPPGRGRALGFPAAVLLAEALRGAVPFGGFPLSGIALGQVSGPLVFSARIGGPLILVGLTAAVGMALVEVIRRRVVAPILVIVVTAGVVGAGITDSSTKQGAPVIAAIVQGGGPRGLRAVFSDADAVFRRHVDASALVKQPVQLVLWPEDVVDLEEPLAGSAEEAEIAQVARDLGATVVAGVVEDDGLEQFRNASVVWAPDGTIIDRYDKVHRVPFGEYVPGRDLIATVADLSIIPRDAIPGKGAGLIRTPVGRLGVLISYEVFFANRARSAVNAGGRILLVPTNAASYKSSQVPTQELAAARLRAVETGREVIQSAPTGYSAFIDARGRLRTRTTLGRQEVREAVVYGRSGRTPYMVTGDFPVLLVSALLLGAGWAVTRVRRERQAATIASSGPNGSPESHADDARET